MQIIIIIINLNLHSLIKITCKNLLHIIKRNSFKLPETPAERTM